MRPDTSATPAENDDENATAATSATPATDAAQHVTEAERLERTAAMYPEDAEHLLLQAAAHYELADARERATTHYDNLLSSPAVHNPTLIRALKAANLWEYGHDAEARAIITGIRMTAPRDPAPWVIIAEALETHDELDEAHETFTAALELLIPESDRGPAPDSDADAGTATGPGPALPPAPTHPLLLGRHRVRRMLNTPHDAWDALADRANRTSVPLDELHDPKRLWSLGSNNPAELRAEISRLRAELGSYREALSRPFPVAVLHWPSSEYAELLTAYPELTSEYPSYEAHLTAVEDALRELAASGTANLGIVTGTVPSYEAFAASEASSPGDASLLPQYATTLAARGRAVAWPPSPDAECWCGSGHVYGGCHGSGSA
ncbi:SEC-C domain-containing protein [Streptomyces beihaiensis]|uniref:SEC-C domain-containing protein n=1 Tax=Streptomyces beihaiensis TaxID=2984495 RepID=A0ABT3U4X2_9ACTN|nr:SEC-C domain-containing protein [Streptomyces beihaiensis]MCX3063627.1 SEC-C domain-containing protein [Streptomyces beihaiensis]